MNRPTGDGDRIKEGGCVNVNSSSTIDNIANRDGAKAICQEAKFGIIQIESA